ncbi:MAG: AMP-binding protein [Muribaculaceae bacterium]|nr:AMP-binding protein [Muribaculaceae bacterium]
MHTQTELIPYVAQALRENFERPAFSNIQGKSYSYQAVAENIARYHLMFEHMGVNPGDKVALCARNCAEWGIGALAVLTFGGVCVPILRDFKPENVQDLVRHSEAKVLLTDDSMWKHLDATQMPALQAAFYVGEFSPVFAHRKEVAETCGRLDRLFVERYPKGFSASDIKFRTENAQAPALINYTSGSTGQPKGVVLTFGNLWSNIQYSIDGLDFLKPGDGMVCMLPLAHMFGFTIEMLHPFVKGCHVNFLTRTPAPKIILGAFAQVRPKLIVTVPLILEKIVRTQIFPTINKPSMKLLLHLPIVGKRIYGKVRQKLVDAFGGNVLEIIVGGAALSTDVEHFLRKIKFPVTVGYGMTECGPLIAYAPWNVRKPGSCGRIVDRMEAKVDSPDPTRIPGVLKVRGANVMNGYFHNEEATAQTIDSDGWMSTGDIVLIDSDGFVTIKGREKNMILGPSGQNIYPEEIEFKLNREPYVAEALVVDIDGKLTALIHPDFDAAEAQNLDRAAIEKIMEENIAKVNGELPAYSKLAGFKIYDEEFEKTPKRSVKRYLYQRG